MSWCLSQGMGAEWLKQQKEEQNLRSLTILPYQPLDHLPTLYGAATALVALLTDDAGAFSVPSKVLTYLAAGKPLLLAVPANNLAARIVTRVGAGIVVNPDDGIAFGQAGLDLLNNPEKCALLGQAARTYAKQAFSIDSIADRFLDIMQQVVR